MKPCPLFGQPKPEDALGCPSCEQIDPEVYRRIDRGVPSLTLLVLGVVAFWTYRFWRIGLAAWSGNLRLAAWLALLLAVAGLMFGSVWSFGIRSRKQAAVIFLIAVAVIALLQFV